jgi:excisionase family DNA binding protein
MVLTMPFATQDAHTENDWMTVPEVATELRIGPRSVYNAISRGELRAARVNERGDLRVARGWLRDYCDQRVVAKTA